MSRRGDAASADALTEGTDKSFHKARAAMVRDGAKDVLNIMPLAPRGQVGGSESSTLIRADGFGEAKKVNVLSKEGQHGGRGGGRGTKAKGVARVAVNADQHVAL